ncbi:MAG: CmcI family methyltransferase [Lysobacterales bacterium]
MTSSTAKPKTSLSDFDSALPPNVLASMQAGVMRYTYRGVMCNKSPFDLALYHLLLDKTKPASIIEIGTKFGGSGLWFADMSSIHCPGAQVIQVDNNPRVENPDSRIQYFLGDANDLGSALSPNFLEQLPKPWLVVEDSAHTFQTCLAVMRFFDPWLHSGDYLVVEDGIVRNFSGAQYAAYEDGPSRAIHDFIQTRKKYVIDRAMCDFFGPNYTYNPSGYLMIQ